MDMWQHIHNDTYCKPPPPVLHVTDRNVRYLIHNLVATMGPFSSQYYDYFKCVLHAGGVYRINLVL